jgi:hypothetical protein
MRTTLSFCFFCILFVVTSCRPGNTNYDLGKPADLNDGIQTSTLEDVGMNKAIINEIIDGISSGFYPNRHSLLIYKNNKLVLERYFTGKDVKAWVEILE